MKRYIGCINLNDRVDITDPCYDKDSRCRMNVDCVPGEYSGYIEILNEGDWGNRVASVSIFKDSEIVGLEKMKPIGEIGVDAGMAGFFNNKPDFNGDEWRKLCDKTYRGDAWNLYNGIFSSSGYGDGVYTVYANEERSAFTIVFIE